MSKRSLDLTNVIARRPFHQKMDKKLSAWASFWISNAFWIAFVLLFGALSMSSMHMGIDMANKIFDLRSQIASIREENEKSIADRDTKIDRLMSFQNASTTDLIALAKSIQEIHETAQNSKQARFLDEALPEALRLQFTENIPASACIAMAIYESQYGQSKLAREHHNFFGLKAFSNWEGKRAENMVTRDSGVLTTADFRAYANTSEGFDGYVQFLKNSDRYEHALQAHNGVEFVSGLLRAGYCPDSTYLDSIRIIMDRHKLNKLDSIKPDTIVRSTETLKSEVSG
ncbi:MAG: glucosaminidase domain-containing protein [Verrucomicrobiota bacterium]